MAVETRIGSYPHVQLFHSICAVIMHPVQEFWVRGQWLSVYRVIGAPRERPYSLYWNDRLRPIRYKMTMQEVSEVLGEVMKEK